MRGGDSAALNVLSSEWGCHSRVGVLAEIFTLLGMSPGHDPWSAGRGALALRVPSCGLSLWTWERYGAMNLNSEFEAEKHMMQHL